MPRTKSTFRKGHRYFAPYSARAVRSPSIRQQRRAQAAALARMIADMSAAAVRGDPVNPNDYVRLVHLQMRVEAEL
jgi:hypothetical protein